MTFEQFFSHPFVALLKMQSAQEFEKADEYIAKARIAEDSKVAMCCFGFAKSLCSSLFIFFIIYQFTLSDVL